MGFEDETRAFRVSSVAIYSLNHKPIGKTTQERPYTTGAHVDYITRPDALSHLAGRGLPVEKEGAMAYFRQAEDDGRKNGRVADKLMLALPRELTPAQQVDLVRGFAEDVSQGKAPWLAAFHGQGENARNPHCHLVLRDADPATGRRVFGTSEKGSTDRLRLLWEQHANRALERAGQSARIDRRTLEAQGIPRPAHIHEGPRSRAAARRGHRPRSKPVNARNGRGARHPRRRVDYPSIDGGRTRTEHNQSLRDAASSPRDYWVEIDRQSLADEMDTLRAIHHPPASVELAFVEAPGRQDRRQHLMAGVKPGSAVDFEGGRPLETQPPLQSPENTAGPAVYRKENHSINYARISPEGKDVAMATDEDLRNRLADIENEKDRIDGLFMSQWRQSFADPAAAMERFEDPKLGEDDCFHLLRSEPGYFGALPTTEPERSNAETARRNLPNLFSDFRSLRDAGDGVQAQLDRGVRPRALDKPLPAKFEPAPGVTGESADSAPAGTGTPKTIAARRKREPEAVMRLPDPAKAGPEATGPAPAATAPEGTQAPQGDIYGLWKQLTPQERELGLRGALARKEQANDPKVSKLDQSLNRFLTDPSKPVKSGPDAPRTPVYETSGNRLPVAYERPQTPQEQQRMTLPEAIRKKGIEPVRNKLGGWFGSKSGEGQEAPSGEPQKAPKGAAPHHPSGPGLDGKPYSPPKEQTYPKLGEVLPRPGDGDRPNHSADPDKAAPRQPDAARPELDNRAPQKEPDRPAGAPRRPDGPSFNDRLNARPAPSAPLAAEKGPSFNDRLNARPAAPKPAAPAGPSFNDRLNARPVPSSAQLAAPAPKAPAPAPTPRQAPEQARPPRVRGFDRER